MNREILFRGFNEDPNGNEEIELDGKIIKGKWVEGFYWNNGVNNHFIKELYSDDKYQKITLEDYEVIPETVSQYTEFLDIYENDIVCISAYSFEEPEFDGDFKVEYDPIVGCWFFVNVDDKEDFYTIEELRNYYRLETKVIGTIFDKREV